jgi:hypothetical protein
VEASQPPVSKRRDRQGKIVAGLATKVQIPQKRSEGGNQLLCGRSSTLTGTIQKKVAYGMRSPLTDILAERLQELRGAASVLTKRRLLHSAMRLKPIAEGSDKS